MNEDWITGVIECIIYSNDDNGYTVCGMTNEDGEDFTATGYLPYAAEGTSLRMYGAFTEHPDYGMQFKISYYEEIMPSEPDAILAYLSSGAISGIGAAMAKRLVKAFGADTLNIMADSPQRMAEVKGISEARAEKIGKSFAKLRHMQDTVMFLQRYKIGAGTAMRVYDTLGENAVKMIETNPYVLSERVEGISFMTADNIAYARGVAKNNPERIRAGIKYILRSAAYSGGHTYMPKQLLAESAEYNLELSDSEIENGIAQLIADKELRAEKISGTDALYTASMYSAEYYCANRLVRMAELEHRFIMEEDEALKKIAQIEEETGVRLADEQKTAVVTAVMRGCMIITGGPGTGKTTTIRTIIRLMEEAGLSIALTAPTGRAAKRMSEVTGIEAKTVHRLLEASMDKGGHHIFMRDEANPLTADVIIADEVSMIDINLMSSFLRAVKPGARLIMAGDADQLPSVGPGNVLRDMIASGAVPVIRLEHIFRQAKESLIVVNAHRINKGEMPELGSHDRDFFYLNRPTAEETAKTIGELYKTRLPKSYDIDPVSMIQVLSPTKKGAAGTVELNRRLQRLVNPPDPLKAEYKHGRVVYRTGDKVMQIKNNYDLVYTRTDGESGAGIFNGDAGIIKYISVKDRFMTIVFDEDKEVEYPFASLDEIDLAYAITVHKSQGSEFPYVIIPVCSFAPMLMCRNLFYTAVTRAKTMVILVGQPRAIYTMVKNNAENDRFTGLAERIGQLEKSLQQEIPMDNE